MMRDTTLLLQSDQGNSSQQVTGVKQVTSREEFLDVMALWLECFPTTSAFHPLVLQTAKLLLRWRRGVGSLLKLMILIQRVRRIDYIGRVGGRTVATIGAVRLDKHKWLICNACIASEYRGTFQGILLLWKAGLRLVQELKLQGATAVLTEVRDSNALMTRAMTLFHFTPVAECEMGLASDKSARTKPNYKYRLVTFKLDLP